MHLFQYVQNNKEADNDWFRLESNKEGTRWFGKCWYIHELLKYEFDVEFDVSWAVMFQLHFPWSENLSLHSWEEMFVLNVGSLQFVVFGLTARLSRIEYITCL